MNLNTCLSYSLLVFVCLNVYVECEEYYYYRGQPCIDTIKHNISIVGTCKPIYQCGLAMKLVQEDEIKPPMCYYENSIRIVCCPKTTSYSMTGEFLKFFKSSTDDIIRSNDITCHYVGFQPMTCCGKPREIEEREPKECPRLPNPYMNVTNFKPGEKFLWNKYLSYQQYFNKCVSMDEEMTSYVRKNTCGMPHTDIRIAGGTPAGLKEFPHMAVLGKSNQNMEAQEDIVWMAGGSLISDKFILTAAHALTSDNAYSGILRYALLGSLNKTDIRSGILYNIIRLIPYKLYDRRSQEHDIALVELDRKVQFSEFIRPICLPLPGMAYNPLHFIIAGWGKTQTGTTETLIKTVVKEEGYHSCEDYLLKGVKFNPKTMICAKGLLRSNGVITDSCEGDSGGPLMVTSKDLECTYIVIGVVSHGPACGKGNAALYTKVSNYLDWIIDNISPRQTVPRS